MIWGHGIRAKWPFSAMPKSNALCHGQHALPKGAAYVPICSNLNSLYFPPFCKQDWPREIHYLLSNRGDPARIWINNLFGIPLHFIFRWIGPWINYMRHMYEQMQESVVDKYGSRFQEIAIYVFPSSFAFCCCNRQATHSNHSLPLTDLR